MFGAWFFVNAAATLAVAPEPHYDNALFIENPLMLYEPAEEPKVEPPDPCENIYNYGCSCIVHLKNKGIHISGYNASDVIPNYFGTPFPGDVALFRYTNTAHAAYVEAVFPSQNFLVSECNYKKGVCGERVILKNDPALIGFIHRGF